MAFFDFIASEKPKEDKNAKFRPFNFSEYIGQPKAKEILKRYIEGSKSMGKVFPHLLISGESGTGKTTIARIIKNELKVEMVEIITSELDKFTDWFSLIQETKGGILFLDELHSIDRNNGEKIYTMMEDFKYHGRPIKPFTVIGATTLLGEIRKDRSPLIERFEIPTLELERYSWEELKEIGIQYNSKSFPEQMLPKETHEMLSKNSRGIPRKLEHLVKATIYFKGDYKAVFHNFGIIKFGFTHKDLLALQYISSNLNGVGLQSIGAYLGTDTQNYMYEIEPWLLQNGLIVRAARGRKLTVKGIKYINSLETTLEENKK